jgi:hypothetical protein
MKAIKLCLVFTLLAYGITSCKKENQFEKQYDIQLTEMDARIEQQVSSFKERMVSPLKSSDSLSIDSTLWYLEITANYTYGDATAHNENVSVDSGFFSIPVGKRMVSMDDIHIAYETMINFVRDHYNGIEASEKHLLSVIVKQESLNSTELTIKAISSVVSGPYTGYFTFEPWESWMYGGGLGMCNGTNLGKDAASEIARRIMARKLVPTGYY